MIREPENRKRRTIFCDCYVLVPKSTTIYIEK